MGEENPGPTDLGTAKALANPVRQRILCELRVMGEATSTSLAKRLGITTGGTSYNLRVLAEHGLVEEVPERARGRERWWRTARKDVRFARLREQDPEMRAATDELTRLWVAEDLETFAEFWAHRERLGEWADAVPFSRGTVRLAMEELGAFFEDYLALLNRYQRPDEDVPSDARTVLTRFIAFPDPREEVED
ncbi:ArsR/SmtB family transcription factor [Umezawaea endophytica]|uniref:Helix-turn-helix domain-containing protein n=1 Tax=Umezawaea endophytica TaxID=1654476 RepID=A0A9X2VIP1_9PSEU|nr:helix-turn-helix domain-containing protein [Umezawaea endophytica]MCS7477381.1 helix-turn-helix domain-containing protein [Umezawaea endophytica]